MVSGPLHRAKFIDRTTGRALQQTAFQTAIFPEFTVFANRFSVVKSFPVDHVLLNMAELKFTHGTVLIDDDDFDRISQRRWCLRPDGYVVSHKVSNGKYKLVWLHRFIMKLADDDPHDVDHKNGNRLDYRKSELRIATRAQNAANRQPNTGSKTSRFKGVSWHTQSGKWAAHIQSRVNGNRPKNLGHFVDETEAARAYNTAALKLWGEFARLNPV